MKKQTTPEQKKKKIVVLPRERRLKKFIGRRTDGEQPVEDSIEDLKAVMLARKMTPGEKLNFIKSHLEGPAREQLRLLPKDDCKNPYRLIEILILWRKEVLPRASKVVL